MQRKFAYKKVLSDVQEQIKKLKENRKQIDSKNYSQDKDV